METRAHHGDAILLIAAALSDSELARFAQAAHSLSLDVLVEVQLAVELDRVLDALGEKGADAIGVNNRDLRRNCKPKEYLRYAPQLSSGLAVRLRLSVLRFARDDPMVL